MVDLSTLALELNTAGMETGEKKAGVILDRLEKNLDRAVQKALEFERRINDAFNFKGSNTSAFAKIEADFQKHTDRLEAIAKQGAARISKIYSHAFTVKGGSLPSAPSTPRAGGGRTPADDLKRQEAAILSLAQAQARLEVAEGKSAQAARTLRSALDRVTAGTAGAIRAQTQLVGIEANLATATGKAETAMLNEARAIARVKQISGDTAGAIKTLDDALKKASNPNSLAAVRAQLQKTYLDTDYANSPLIGAIRKIGEQSQKLGQAVSGVGRSLAVGLTAPILAVGAASVKSAVDIDRQVNVLKSLLGSADAAEARFKALVAISAKSPGLTTSLAATLDAQLRVVNVTEASINRLLPVIGKLNAVSPLGDPQKFTGNLVQLISQNFERQDLKELVGQSPLGGELIKQVFNVDSPTNAKAIRESAQKLGITTVDALANALADAADKNSKLAGVTESLGAQFDKLKDRVAVALRPIGLELVKALTPLAEKAIPIIERLTKAFSELSPGAKASVVVFAGIAAAIGPALIAAGSLISSFATLAGLFGASGVLAGAGAALAPLAPAIVPITAAVAALAVAWATDFGGIRAITEDAAKFIVQQFGLISRGIDDLKPAIRSLKPEFERLSKESAPIIKGFWEEVKRVTADSIGITVGFISTGIDRMVTIIKDGVGIARGALATLGGGLLGDIGSGFLQGIERGLGRGRDPRAIPRGSGQGLDGEEITAADLGTNNARLANLAAEEARRKKALSGAGSVGAARSRTKELSELDQLTKQLREAEKDVSSFQNVTSKEFGLRIDLEDTRRFKSQLEEIISLRRTLNEPLRAALPTDKRGADAAIAQLNALKDLRDAESKFDTRGPFIQAQEASIAATAEQTAQLDRLVNDALPKAETATTAAALAQNEYFLALAKTNPALAEQYRQQATATDAAIKAAEATKTLKSIQDALTGDLDQFQNLTREQTTALELQRAGITDLTNAEVQRTLGLARQIDSQDALQRAYEESQRITEQFASTTKDAFTTLFTDGPKAFAERTLDTFKRLFADIAAEVATSGVLRLLGLGGGKAGLGAGTGASGGGNGGGGFNPLSLLTGGGQQGGGGNFLTGGFSGGSPAQQILSGGGQGSPLGGLLSKLPGVGKLFGASVPQFAAGGKIGANIGALPGIGQFNIPGLGTPPISASGLPGAAAPGALAGLGATGLLAGGFLGGSLLGGDSTAGKLIGGAGGALALGALGGSGLLGGGLAAALPALFSNPITAVIGGGLLATALAFRLFGNQDFKKFQKAVDTTYQVRVEGDKQGKGLFEQIKSIGEASFGKGQFKKKIPETIRLTPAKDLIAAYGEATDQTQSALVKRATTTREIGSEGNAANRFIRRAMGGLIPLPRFAGGFVNLPDTGGDSVATALRGQEYVTRPEVTRAMGVRRFDALNAGQASIVTHDQRGARDLAALLDSGKLPLFSRRMRQGLAAQLQFSETGAPSQTFLRRATGGFVGDALPYSAPVQMPTYARAAYTPTIPQQPAAQSTNPISSAELTGLRVMMAAVAETVSNLDAHLNAVPAGHVFVAGMRGNEAALADAASQGFSQSTTATQAAQRILGVQQ